MAITNNGQLKTAVASWLARSDLTSVIPDFITLAEAVINRKLRTRWQEAALTSQAISSYALTIPTGALEVKHLWPDSQPQARIQQKTLDWVIERQYGSQTGMPRFFAWSTTQWVFDASGTISGVYYIKVPALTTDGSTNWLLTDHPDVYLYATLMQASVYLKDSQAALAYDAKTAQLIEELNAASRAAEFSGGKLVAVRR